MSSATNKYKQKSTTSKTYSEADLEVLYKDLCHTAYSKTYGRPDVFTEDDVHDIYIWLVERIKKLGPQTWNMAFIKTKLRYRVQDRLKKEGLQKDDKGRQKNWEIVPLENHINDDFDLHSNTQAHLNADPAKGRILGIMNAAVKMITVGDPEYYEFAKKMVEYWDDNDFSLSSKYETRKKNAITFCEKYGYSAKRRTQKYHVVVSYVKALLKQYYCYHTRKYGKLQ